MQQLRMYSDQIFSSSLTKLSHKMTGHCQFCLHMHGTAIFLQTSNQLVIGKRPSGRICKFSRFHLNA